MQSESEKVVFEAATPAFQKVSATPRRQFPRPIQRACFSMRDEDVAPTLPRRGVAATLSRNCTDTAEAPHGNRSVFAKSSRRFI
jgi:hypothetical protein